MDIGFILFVLSISVFNNAPDLPLILRLSMARTYHQSAMEDLPLFTTATEFGELELFDSLNFSGESELQPNYDVFNLEDAKSSLSNLSPEELLQGFDFEGKYNLATVSGRLRSTD